MSGPARTLTLTICAAYPTTGDSERRLWVCGRLPGHDGNHIDAGGLGVWPARDEDGGETAGVTAE